MKEEQFIKIPSQGNIYSTTKLQNLVLLGSGKYGKVFVYTNPVELEEVSLADIPTSGVSIEGLHGISDENQTSLGVTYVETGYHGMEETKTSYLNIYSSWFTGDVPITSGLKMSKEGQSLSLLEEIAHKCLKFKLEYFPYHLSSVSVTEPNGSKKILFLLTGSDRKVHTFEPVNQNTTFIEVPTKKYFPELSGIFPAIITQLQTQTVPGLRKRITICGCEEGTLHAFIVDENITTSETAKPVSSTPADDSISSNDQKELDLSKLGSESGGSGDTIDSLISTMNESLTFGVNVFRYKAHFDGMINAIRFFQDGVNLNAVVASANSPTYIYTNIVETEFASGLCLKFSSRWDSVGSSCVVDIDKDGEDEIILGTFGCTMLVYKFLSEIGQWVVVSHQKFPSGILTIDYFDSYLYVVSASGLHILENSGNNSPLIKDSAISIHEEIQEQE